MSDTSQLDLARHGGASLRTFMNVAVLWHLSDDDQMRMLGIEDRLSFEHLTAAARANDPVAVPVDVIVRIGCVISIYASLRKLLVSDSGIARWPHRPIEGPTFLGRSPLSLMTTDKLADLDAVTKYLLGQIYG